MTPTTPTTPTTPSARRVAPIFTGAIDSIGVLALALSMAPSEVQAQGGPGPVVYSSCPQTGVYAAAVGQPRPQTQDVNGNLCTAGSGGGGGGGTVNQGNSAVSPGWWVRISTDSSGTPIIAPALGVQPASSGQAVTFTTGSQLQIIPSGGAGLSVFSSGMGSGLVNVDVNPGQIYWYYIDNPNTSMCYLQYYNAASASVTVGTTVPFISMGIPASTSSPGGANATTIYGLTFSGAISIVQTTSHYGSGTCASGMDVNLGYK